MIQKLLGSVAEKAARLCPKSYPYPLGTEVEALRQCSLELAITEDFLKEYPILETKERDDFGGEHDVWYSEADGSVIKATNNNRYGILPDKSGREAKPTDYLFRLILVNEVFGDEIELIGVWLPKDSIPRIVTRQPWLTAMRDQKGQIVIPSEQQISEWMEGRGFARIPADGTVELWSMPYRGGNLIVADMIPRNAVILENGELAFWDVLLELRLP